MDNPENGANRAIEEVVPVVARRFCQTGIIYNLVARTYRYQVCELCVFENKKCLLVSIKMTREKRTEVMQYIKKMVEEGF